MSVAWPGACLSGAVAGCQAMLPQCRRRQSEPHGSTSCTWRDTFNARRAAFGREDAQGCS